jgi:hypothetical protein
MVTNIICSLSILFGFVSKDLSCLNIDQKEAAKYLGSLDGSVILDDGKIEIRMYSGNDSAEPAIKDSDIEKLILLKDRITSIGFSTETISTGGLKRLNSFVNIEYLQIISRNFNDSCSGIFKSFRSLNNLTLYSAQITDMTLKEICKVKTIERLDLTKSTIGDDGIEYLSSLENLNNLVLDNTKVTNVALKKLSESNLNKLTHLWLNNTNIDDQGAEYLLKIPSLSNVYLVGTKVSPQMAEKLRKGLYKKGKIDFDIRIKPLND